MKYVIYIILVISSQAYASRTVELANTIATIEKAARVAEVPAELLIAICFVESSLRPNLAPRMDGRSHSHGVCQVKLETAQFTDRYYKHHNLVTEKRLQQPFLNAFYAAKYLKYQLTRYDNNWEKAVDAYNKGSVVSTKSKYVRKVYSALERF